LFAEQQKIPISNSIYTNNAKEVINWWSGVFLLLQGTDQYDTFGTLMKKLFYKDNMSLIIKDGIPLNYSKTQKYEDESHKRGVWFIILNYLSWVIIVFLLNKIVEEIAGMVSDYQYFSEFHCDHSIPYTTVESWIQTLPPGDKNW